MEIKIVFENSKINSDFKQGHGLSILIIDADKKYLFDTGANKKLIYNANKLGESLTDLDAVIISHGHSDHTNGLQYLDLTDTPIYAAAEVDLPHFIKIISSFLYVGIPKKKLTEMKKHLTIVKKKTEFIPHFFLVPLGKTKDITKNLYKKKNDNLIHDDFADELMLVIEQKDGLIVFTGCSHHGIVTMAEKALQLFPKKKIKYLIGGFHMIGIPYINNLGMSKQEIMTVGEKLNNLNIEKILTCHCTGKKAFTILKKILGNKLETIKTGQKITLN